MLRLIASFFVTEVQPKKLIINYKIIKINEIKSNLIIKSIHAVFDLIIFKYRENVGKSRWIILI